MIKWLDNITNKIIENNNGKDTLICQCGISTTGIAHVGNYRELIITYLVSEALRFKGKNTRVLLSFDDFDRFKKIPFGVPEYYSEYIGMPTSAFLSHVDASMKYATYYEKLIAEDLEKLGIEMEYISQTGKYQSNEYLKYIEHVLEKKEEIFDIISNYKTQELNDNDKQSYYPIKVYCSACKKDTTHILQYFNEEKTISYVCDCSFCETNKIENLNIKMKFNVEWSARWNYENVDFESCGKGHAEKFGVLNIARQINECIYNGKNPEFLVYDFINLKGNNGRMNKNSKNIIKMSDLLFVLPKNIILFYFLINDPNKEMSFSIEDDIPKIYKMYENYFDDKNCDQDVIQLLKIDTTCQIKFDDLVKYLPISNFDINILKKYIDFETTDANLQKIECVSNWLKKYSKNKYWEFEKSINYDYYNNLSISNQRDIDNFVSILKSHGDSTFNELFNEFKMTEPDYTSFYKNFYMMTFGVEKGIPIRTLYENFNIEDILKLFPVKKKDYIKKDIVRLIQLSDLHIDVDDNQNEIKRKIDIIINTLKGENFDNYLLLSGDVICFYNMDKDYRLALDYLNDIITELHITKSKIFVCTGNHEMMSYNEFSEDYFRKYDQYIKNRLKGYNEFLNLLCDRSISSSDELYSLYTDNPFDLLVINSLYEIKDGNGTFHQDLGLISNMLCKYKKNNDKYRFIMSHAPYNFNRRLFDETNIKEFSNINICGHKHENSCIINNNGIIDIISGGTEGIVDNEYCCNIIELKDGVLVKKMNLSGSNIGILK